MIIVRKLFLIIFLLICLQLKASEPEIIYAPRIEGTIRGKYEYFTEINEQRFQVRNARFSLRGNISPFASYKAEIDLSDEGKTKMLDAFVKLQPQKWWDFTIGQQKVPFSTDNLRSPHQLYFANRSFMGKQLTNLRDVGVSLHFRNEEFIPFDFTTGVYNGLGLYSQDKPLKANELSYAGRLEFQPLKNLKVSLNANTINPYKVRMNFYNVGIAFNVKNLHIESEYLHKAYSSDSIFDLNATNGFFVFGAYDIHTPKLKAVKKITPLLRYDMMTKNMRYEIANSATIIQKYDNERSRITGGLTISLAKPFVNDIRLNYEQYMWADGTKADSKFVAEFVVKF
jgi:hypothetical protein